ncbi:MAG: ABC transporter ATP-binding protein [Burkholderiaceae bacterium]
MTDSEAGIEVRRVGKRYGIGADTPWAVDDISLAVPKGTLTTLLGPSGCGKTTLLRLIAGLETPSAGTIFIDGRDVTALGAAQRNVCMVFQSYALFPHMNVLANVSYGLDVSGVAKSETKRRAQAALATVGLTEFDVRAPSELSGGQQQRVALARALVLEPAVLLFDEPLSNLDARLRRSMREEIRSLQQRLQLTVAYVTHDQSEALAVSDHIVVMHCGRIAQIGTPRQLYESPGSEFVAGFMGEANVFAALGQVDGSVRLGPLTLRTHSPVPAGPLKLAVRPQSWQVSAGAGDDALPAKLSRCAYLGSHYELSFDSDIGAIFVVTAEVERTFAPGQRCWLRLAKTGVSVLRG